MDIRPRRAALGRGLLALLPAVAAACGGDGASTTSSSSSTSSASSSSTSSGAPAPSFHYPLDAKLRFNHLQAKATHNSYHVDTNGGAVAAWAYTHAKLSDQLAKQGVRSFELDVHYNKFTGAMDVFHESIVDEGTTCRVFVDCLKEIRTWSDAHPAHEPFCLQIEPKDEPDTMPLDAFWKHLEAEILMAWPKERIITPDLVQGSAATLRDAVVDHGFPTLGELRGKILFALDNTAEYRDAYLKPSGDLQGKLVFVDSRPTDVFGAVAILNDPTADAEAIKQALAANFLIRTRADSDSVEAQAGSTARRDAALASGAHFVSTDYPVPAANGYVVTIPGGAPSRCNPVTAPPECAPEDIENPAFITAPGGP